MARCDCCGCVFASDYGTSLVTGEGTKTEPFVISKIDPSWVRPAVRVRSAVNRSIATGASFVAITFDTEVFDQGANMWVVGSPTLITIPENGIYIFGGCGQWAANATGTRELGIRRNGSQILQVNDHRPDANLAATAPLWGHVTYQYRLNAGDTLEFVARQESGGALNLVANADESITFWCVYAGRTV